MKFHRSLRTIWTIAVQRKTEGNSELCERPNIRNNRPQFFRNVRETESKLLKSVPSYL